ncbi:MAG TPA: nucleotide sugar dehydrogenase [Vicinamibacterales bacterium]|nr:nucleotide sugar dehydrogenase [Vicinamibacterales bacterium]
MRISIFGLGYVGAVSLACLARDGHDVIGVDVDVTKIDLIRQGRTPVVEEGMIDLMAQVVASGRVKVTADLADAIQHSDISLVCVGTPSAANGSQDQRAVLRLAEALGAALARKDEPHVIVFRSTLVPGTVEDVLRPIIERASGKKDGEAFHLCFQPEFLREGSSIRDYDHPPLTVVGANHPDAAGRLRELFGHLACRFVETSVRSAEMMKYCCNNFHALKITFANEVARLCDALGVDPFEVMELVCQDTSLNISRAYLRPGFAFGGSCLPKDLRATAYLAKMHDVELPMLSGILASNREHIDRAVARVLESGCRRVGLIGLSFKAGTDDLRESPLVSLAEQLVGKGVRVSIYDPDVHLSRLLGANKRFIEMHLPHIGGLLEPDLPTVVTGAQMLIVATANQVVLDAVAALVAPEQRVLDVIGLRPGVLPSGRFEGLCWGDRPLVPAGSAL